VIRRRPVAVYRVIDEEELLGEPAIAAPVAHPAPQRRATRRLPRRSLALAGAVAIAALAAVLVAGAPAAPPRERDARPASITTPTRATAQPTLVQLATPLGPDHRRRTFARRQRTRSAPDERAPRAVPPSPPRAVPPSPAHAVPPSPPALSAAPDPAAEFGFER